MSCRTEEAFEADWQQVMEDRRKAEEEGEGAEAGSGPPVLACSVETSSSGTDGPPQQEASSRSSGAMGGVGCMRQKDVSENELGSRYTEDCDVSEIPSTSRLQVLATSVDSPVSSGML